MYETPLLDMSFLKQLFNIKNQETYAKLTAIDFITEQPLEEIQGKIQSNGSINIDGSSSVRRTCSFTIVSDSIKITDYYWTLRSKFKLEIGLKNKINTNYPSIIWFPQGVFIINSFSCSISVNNAIISISGKDKMCLLNGEVGGQFASSVNLSTINYYNELGEVIESKQLLLKEIIFNLVNIFGQELRHNILINDLDEIALELIQYNGSNPLYLLRNSFGEVINIITDENTPVFFLESKEEVLISSLNNYYSLSPLSQNLSADKIILKPSDHNWFYVIKLEYGQVAGYRETELVYPESDFILKANQSITNALDLIIKHFVDYEYFYDIYGRFVFQKKKTYINTKWSPIDPVSLKVDFLSNNAEIKWSLENGELITAFSNAPNLLNLKNDFTVWGERTSATGQKIPIHGRYAIDIKPTTYTTTGLDGTISKTYTSEDYDWRELIFQMAIDYYNNNQKGSVFYQKLKELNSFVKNGLTGYEQYYTDILGFWRQLYDGSDWLPNILDTPETLPFWFDFIEGNKDLSSFSIKNIGDRPKVVNDTKASVLCFRDVVNVLYVKTLPSQENRKDGYTYIILPEEYESLFSISKSQKSIQQQLDLLLYNHSYCIENINISIIPIYCLQPNIKILVNDNTHGIYGQYIINKLSISLSNGGTMQINAIKDVEKFY